MIGRAVVRADILYILLVLLVGLALRLPKFESRALWFDEVFQVHMSSAPDWATLSDRVIANDRNPPAGHLFTRAGLFLFGGEVGARLPSLVCGLACIPLGWAAGRFWGNRATGFWVAILVCVAPAFVFYSREARAYMPGMATLFGLIAASGWFRIRPTFRSATVFVIAAMLASSIQYAGMVVTAIWLASVWFVAPTGPAHRAMYRRGWVVACTLSGLLVAMWVTLFMLPQVRLRSTGTADTEFTNYFWHPNSVVSSLRFVTNAIPDFFQYPILGGNVGPRWTLLALLALLPTLIPIVRIVRAQASLQLRMLVGFAIATLLGFVLLAGFGQHPFGGTRHCLPLVPGLFLLLANGLSWIGGWCRPLAVAWGLFTVSLMSYGNYHVGWNKHDHSVKPLVASVADVALPGDPVLIVGGAVNTFKYYEAELNWPGPVFYSGPYLNHRPDRRLNEAIDELLLTYSRVWLVEFTPYDPVIEKLVFATQQDVVEYGHARATLWVTPAPRSRP